MAYAIGPCLTFYQYDIMNRFALTFASLVIVFCACGPDNPAEQVQEVKLSLDTESISVQYEVAEKKVTVTADGDWGVSSQDRSWVNVSPGGGVEGTSVVTVKIDENKTGEVRETELVFTTRSGKTRLPVRQNYMVEAVYVSDMALLAALLRNLDADGDGILSTREVEGVTELDLSDSGLSDISELPELFPELESLDVSGNRLTSIDIRMLPNLTHLDATGNPDLTTVYVWSDFEAPDGFSIPSSAEYVEPDIPTPAGYELVWQDEFNTAGESLPDASMWWYETGDGGWGNNELQDYVSGVYKGEKIAKVENGILSITAKKIDGKVRSVRMNTKEGWTYGYFEARLKLPEGKGTWPAFWMMPKNFTAWPKDGEIDIMEHVGYHADYVSSSIHCTAYVHSNGTQKTKERYLKGATDEFHVYALEWTPEYIRSYVDGEPLFYYNPEDYPKGRNADTWPFDDPFYLKLNLAWGGNWGGAQGIDENCLPAVYEIDYVRVFQKTVD